MGKILITGAAGLIGSGVVRHLNDEGRSDLILVDTLDHPDKERNLFDKKYEVLLGIDEVFSWLLGREEEIEAIIHLGACSDTTQQDVVYLKHNNTRYTQKLAEYALKNRVRFIYASSAATYGDGSQGFSDHHDHLEELKPLNFYAHSKHAFDLWAKQEGVLNQIVGLKYFNVFGPNEGHKKHMASVIYKMVPLIQTEGIIRLFKSTAPSQFKDGDQCRDFIYVKDAVRMTCQFLRNDFGGIYNIGMGVPSTWNQVAYALFKALGKNPKIEYIHMPEELKERYQNYTCAEMEKFKKILPLNIHYSLEQSIEDYLHNHLLPGKVW